VEAIVEVLEVKKTVFASLEKIVSKECILATNTSSLSIAAISSACVYKERVIGLHFFNPAPIMPLVEVIPGVATKEIGIKFLF
jgi:3-hydroxybutyryl-CoA dehydrogenase